MGPLLLLQAVTSTLPPGTTRRLSGRETTALERCLEILDRLDGLMLPVGDRTPHIIYASDAQGFADSTGFPAAIGIYFGPQAYYRLTSFQLVQLFPDAPDPRAHISIFEAYAPLVPLRLNPERFQNKLIGVLLDNPAAAAVLSKLRGPTAPGPLRAELQRIAELYFWELTKLNARFSDVRLVPGEQNPYADAVSRGNWKALQALIHAGQTSLP